jgi:hypothetical protein
MRANAAGALDHQPLEPIGDPMSTVTSLSARRLEESGARLNRHVQALADSLHPVIPISAAGIPADVLADLEELDALHETAADVYDGATAELDEARKILQEAAWALTEAEEAWSKAGAEMNDAARTLAAAREAAGVRMTASGYRPVTS